MKVVEVTIKKKVKVCQHGRVLELDENCVFDRAFGVDLCSCSHPIFDATKYASVVEVKEGP